MRSIWWLGIVAPLFSAVGPHALGQTLVPRLDGDPWVVARNPDLGKLGDPKQQPVDFSIWQADDGTWQIWSCIRGTNCGGRRRLLYGWEGANLTDPDWKPKGIAMQADEKLGETAGGLQAPFVFTTRAGTFVMAYGDWTNICFARSADGKKFERWLLEGSKRSGRIHDGPQAHARDAMLLKIDDLWHCYYAAFIDRQGAIYCRKSPDLITWSEPVLASRGGRGGTGRTDAECPYVVQRGGHYYLFRTQRYGKNATTHVYRSSDPMKFNVDTDDGYVCTLPLAAPEVCQYRDQDYIAHLLPSLKGIQIAKLKWEPQTDPAKP